MQLSGAHGRVRSTGALLLPLEAVVSGEPARTLAADDRRVSERRRSRTRFARATSVSPTLGARISEADYFGRRHDERLARKRQVGSVGLAWRSGALAGRA